MADIDDGWRGAMSADERDALVTRLSRVPGVVSATPVVESQALAQGPNGAATEGRMAAVAMVWNGEREGEVRYVSGMTGGLAALGEPLRERRLPRIVGRAAHPPQRDRRGQPRRLAPPAVGRR